jgi:hypothetical protein
MNEVRREQRLVKTDQGRYYWYPLLTGYGAGHQYVYLVFRLSSHKWVAVQSRSTGYHTAPTLKALVKKLEEAHPL